MWYVYDNHTEAVMGKYQSAKRARTKANTLDLTYGAVRYSVRYVA